VSFGLVLGWSALAQQRLGLAAGGASAASELQAECIAGSWVGAINAGQLGDASLSPGDLDEAIMTLTRLPGNAGSFERVRAMRNGFTNGSAPCLKTVV
jgi:predicted metalloprotease